MDKCDVQDEPILDQESKYRKVYKRRSSIFQVKARQIEQNEDDKENSQAEKKSTENEELLSNLQEYVNSLREERTMWQNLLKERKAKRRILTKQKAIIKETRQDLDLSVLSDSDKEFLKIKPDYNQLCKNCETLQEAAITVNLLSKAVHRLNVKAALRIEGNLYKTTKQIIQIS